MGAFFYVRPETREQAAALMLENGYVPVAPGEAVAESAKRAQFDAGWVNVPSGFETGIAAG